MTVTDTAAAPATTPCPRCRTLVPAGELVCPHCGLLVHGKQLERLAGEAINLERTDPAAAARVWRQMLSLLPTNSRQHQEVSQRVAALMPGAFQSAKDRSYDPDNGTDGEHDRPVIEKGSDPLPLALFKTIGSMALSILAYMWAFGWDWRLAVGFVLLILIHEMGHVIALRHYGYSASPPIFIPFMGALINLRQPPRNAWEEAIIGIGGPVLGTIGSLACFAVWWVYPESTVALKVAIFGFMLNFFNMLPIPPLDGGRVTAAISPWAWIVGLGAMGYWVVHEYMTTGHVNFILVLILFMAYPRIRDTLQNKAIRNHPYFQIGRAKNWTMGIAYLALACVLAFFYFGYRTRLWA